MTEEVNFSDKCYTCEYYEPLRVYDDTHGLYLYKCSNTKCKFLKEIE